VSGDFVHADVAWECQTAAFAAYMSLYFFGHIKKFDAGFDHTQSDFTGFPGDFACFSQLGQLIVV
jgi:hypothetical protein